MEETQNNEVGGNRKSGKSRGGKFIVVVIILAILGAGYYFWQGDDSTMSISNSATVAMVNGEEITGEDFNESFTRLSVSLKNQGVDVASSTIQDLLKQQVLDGLIGQALVTQEANKEGITVNSADVDSLFENNKANFKDSVAFKEALKAEGFTDATFKDALEMSLLSEAYLVAHIDLTSLGATDQEIQDSYDQSVAGSNGQNIPTLSEVRSQIEQEVIQKKRQALVMQYLQELRASGEIEILI